MAWQHHIQLILSRYFWLFTRACIFLKSMTWLIRRYLAWCIPKGTTTLLAQCLAWEDYCCVTWEDDGARTLSQKLRLGDWRCLVVRDSSGNQNGVCAPMRDQECTLTQHNTYQFMHTNTDQNMNTKAHQNMITEIHQKMHTKIHQNMHTKIHQYVQFRLCCYAHSSDQSHLPK